MKHVPLPVCACAVILSFLSATAQATTVYWDVNGEGTAGAGGPAATGAWNATATNWNKDSNGDAALGPVAAWVDGDTAIFSAGNDATGAFTVTVTPSGTPLAAPIAA